MRSSWFRETPVDGLEDASTMCPGTPDTWRFAQWSRLTWMPRGDGCGNQASSSVEPTERRFSAVSWMKAMQDMIELSLTGLSSGDAAVLNAEAQLRLGRARHSSSPLVAAMLVAEARGLQGLADRLRAPPAAGLPELRLAEEESCRPCPIREYRRRSARSPMLSIRPRKC